MSQFVYLFRTTEAENAEHMGTPERAQEAMRGWLDGYPFYAAALGQLELRRGAVAEARAHFERARASARNDAERSFLERRLRAFPPT